MKLYPETVYPATLHDDQWSQLKQFTDARIALGRAGCSIPTKALLNFQLAHAQAKDAVLCSMDVAKLQQQLDQLNINHLHVQSCASNKDHYLTHPDLGRLLSDQSKTDLDIYHQQFPQADDVLIVVGDGLSAMAIETNAIAFISAFQKELATYGWSLAPIVLATGSRVALGDEVAERLKAKMLVMLIGERPGLSSPDSMGIYYTWQAHSGSADSERNCISNIRPAGLSIHIAVQRLLGLMQKSNEVQFSGVHLKDEHSLELESCPQSTQRLF